MNKTESNVKDMPQVKPFEVNQAMVALELGNTDDAILHYLNFLTQKIPTQALYFLHVLPEINLYNTLYEEEARTVFGNDYELDRDVIERMELSIKGKIAAEKDLFIEFDVKEGNPLEQLLQDADEVKADLVVIGQKTTPGSHGILAKKLARQVSCNALVIPDQARRNITSILVPIDFSPNSAEALKTAVAINKQLPEPAEIVVLNVYEVPDLSVYKIGKTREQLHAMLEEDRTAALQAFIRRFVPEAEDSIRKELIPKDMPGVANYLMDFALENDTDFIVMGAKGHSKVELLLLGSVTEKMLTLNKSIATLIVK